MMNIRLRSLVLFGLLVTGIVACKKGKDGPPEEEQKPVAGSSPYISKILEFKQAPGQYTNDLIKTDILIGSAGNGLVSLGGYGGYIIFGFDHSVENANGVDLGIYGNPLIGQGFEFSEPGIVSVMKDENKNGLADDTWYELAGSEYSAATTVKNYTITYYRPANAKDDVRWTDNQGREGLIL
ncbi:MAG: PKD domain-containing protein, partial [Pedobacter sp.]